MILLKSFNFLISAIIIALFLNACHEIKKKNTIIVSSRICDRLYDSAFQNKFNLTELEKFKNQCIKDKNDTLLSNYYVINALHQRSIGDYIESYKSHLEALELRKKIKDENGVGRTMNNLASDAVQLGRNEIAQRYLDSAVRIFIKQNDTNHTIISLQQLGRIHSIENNPEKAKIEFLKAFRLSNIFNNADIHAQLLNSLGNVYAELKLFDSSNFYYKQAVFETEKLQDSAQLVLLYMNIANNYLSENKTIYAKLFLNKCAALLPIYGSKWDKNLYNENFAYYLQQSNKSREAFDSLLITFNEYKKLFRTEKAQTLTELETKYNLKEKDAANRLLTAQNSRKTWIANSLIAGMLLLAGLGLILYRNFKQKQKIAQQTIVLKSNEINELLNQQELEIFDAALRGQDEERNRIARELHDRLGGLLSITKLNFTSVEKDLKQIELKNRENFEQVNANLSEAMDELRRISHDLYAGSVINFGIVTALHQLCAAVEKSSHITVKFQALKVPSNLLQSTQIELYRVTQELLQNSLKHANANRIDISILISENNLVLNYEDNGNGFDTSTEWKKGMGFQNIETRIRKLSGNWNIDSSPGKGIFFSAEMPLLSNIIQDS